MMPLSVPSYIHEANIQENTIRYKWDDWNVEQAEEPIDKDFFGRLKGISQRANVAFTIGTAEWIIHRFGTLCDDPLPLQYLEAAWAQIVHWRYIAFTWEDHTDKKSWSGPIKGPLGIAMTRVMYAIQQAEEDEVPELRAAWITNLVQYVMTDPTPYQNWRERIIERLERLYPRDPDETQGEVVARQALDPHYNFEIEQTESLINQFLASLDYKANPFLNSPEAMLEEGFEGTPYVFDIVEDRKARFEW
jgi:hypothetical protein